MNLDPQLIPWFVVAGFAVLWVTQSLRLWWLRRRPARILRATVRRGAAGEDTAHAILRAHGFEVLETQATCRWCFRVGREPRTVTLRADFLVRRRGRRYVADAKTGDATRLTAPTRRQLLEYRLAFDVDGVLLIDAQVGRIQEIVFNLP